LDLKIELDGDEIVVSRERVFSWHTENQSMNHGS
jgi:hypothetical protein